MTAPRNPKVLVVDDERIIADTLSTILVQSGFDVRVTYSGEAAIETARNFHPDALITDVVMHGITGIDAAIKVREMLPHCKVLLFSGQATIAGLLEDARAHNYEFELIAKPVHPAELIAKLSEVIAA